jgi:hypothetical protein
MLSTSTRLRESRWLADGKRSLITLTWIAGLLVPVVLAAADEPAAPDPWEPVRVLVGEWVGRAQGQSGTGTVRRKYSFVLRDRYLYETNISTYPSKGGNRDGEEHWSMISYDRVRDKLVLRQFHQEGFVNQYEVNTKASGLGRLVFDSVRFENLGKRWKARETYEILGVDEFIETFEVGEPGKKLEVYSRNHFKRYKGQRCADNALLKDIKEKWGILVLCAATDVVAGADSACVATLGDDWVTWNADELAERIPPDKVAATLDWVCGTVLSLPTGEDSVVTRHLWAWCAVYRALPGSAEAMATAAYRIPALSDLLGENAEFRAGPDGDIGESLASAEHTHLRYRLAGRISGMPEPEMARTLLQLSDETTRIIRNRR